MVTSNQEPDVKELLSRINIRTMKKDLKKLREDDSLKEREKISKLKFQKKSYVRQDANEAKADALEIRTPVVPPKPAIPTPTIVPIKEATAPTPVPPIAPALPSPAAESPIEISAFDIAKEREQLLEQLQDQKPEPLELVPKPSVIAQEKISQIKDNISEEFKEALIETPTAKPVGKKPEASFSTPANTDEAKKQQAFLLKSQKTGLEKELKSLQASKNHHETTQRHKLLTEEKNWQNRLAHLATQEEKTKEEDQLESLEKVRQNAEVELKKTQEEAKELDQKHEEFLEKESSLKKQIADIDASLKELHVPAAHEKKPEEHAKKTHQAPAHVKTEHTPEHQTHQEKTPATHSAMEDKEFLKNVPAAAKEKLVASTKIEEVQRRKFMEDVERWAAMSEKESDK